MQGMILGILDNTDFISLGKKLNVPLSLATIYNCC